MILKLNTISWIVILDLSPRYSIASCEGVGEVEYQAEYCADAAKLGHTGSLAIDILTRPSIYLSYLIKMDL